MSRPRRFTVDEALRQLMEEGDDDFQGIEGAMEEDSGETSGEDDSSEQRMWGSGTREFLPLMDDISSSEDDWEEAHPLDRRVDDSEAAARYCGVQQKEGTGDEEDCGGTSVHDQSTPRRVCGCRSNCLDQFDPTEVDQFILNMLEMEKSERDLLVLGVLESLRHSKETITKGKKAHKICLFVPWSKSLCWCIQGCVWPWHKAFQESSLTPRRVWPCP